ncbi:MAG: hypothetical protein M3Y56_04830 [Armatimonadota bacterium]|nr:hypothetical protein [Armatimonadota bacterium]
MSMNMKKVAAAAVAFLTLAATGAQAASFSFEAESANKITPPFRIGKTVGCSGGLCVFQPLHSGRPPAVKCWAGYKINITTPGRYRVWGRCLWQNGCGNSFDVQIDNSQPYILGQDGTYNRWHWVEVKGHAFNLSRGVHSMYLRNREDGPTIDQYYFTTDDDDVPAGSYSQNPGILVR